VSPKLNKGQHDGRKMGRVRAYQEGGNLKNGETTGSYIKGGEERGIWVIVSEK